jgi:hypothetical protein
MLTDNGQMFVSPTKEKRENIMDTNSISTIRRRHLKRYYIKEIHEALLTLARLHIQEYCSWDDGSWVHDELNNMAMFGLSKERWNYTYKERHKAKIHFKMNDAICSAIKTPNDNLLEVNLALTPSYERYYPEFWNSMEAIDVNIRLDGLNKTVWGASLDDHVVKQLLQNHSLLELQQMRDQLTGVQTAILLKGRFAD